MWIETRGPQDDPVIKDLYERMQGRVVPMIQVFTLKPELLKAVVALTQQSAFGGTSLGRCREELIAAHVCHLQRCKLCTVSHSGQLLRVSGRGREWVKQVLDNPDEADLDPGDRAILAFAGKMTLHASEMTAADTEALRQAGFSDLEILEIGAVAAFYNWVPRIIGAFGLTISKRQAEWAEYIGYDAGDATPDPPPLQDQSFDFVEAQARLWR
jgi:uncharacterized peroxidase-related enzyme